MSKVRKKNPFNVRMSDREKDLMSLGKPVLCSACRETSCLYPKAVGYQPYIWEVNCSLCHRYDLGLNAYISAHRTAVVALGKLRDKYLEGASSQELENAIDSLAEEYDCILDNQICDCGGKLSVSAKPKCIYCDIEIFDSYFHVADQAPPGK